MKKIHIKESKLNEIRFRNGFCAGTDQPYYENEETGEVYEATWNGDYGFPFGFWPIDSSGEMEFVIGEPWATHANACGQCAERYFMDFITESLEDQANQIAEGLNNLVNDFKDYGYTYNEDEDVYYSSDGTVTVDRDDCVNLVNDEVYEEAVDSREYVVELVEEFLENGEIPSYDEIERHLYDMVDSEYDFRDQQGINDALEQLGMDFYQYFEMGNSEGRIWPEREMIGFYESEQPDPNTLEYILKLLQEKSGLKIEDMLQYHMVFEDWRNDGTITACTVQDYIDGNYGPESYEDLDNEDDTPIQYNNGQKTVFVPHLANQQDKFNYYRDFRNTRDRAVYAPQERAAGNLAAYHAMRYPYGESKNKIGKIIREEINNIIREL